MDQLFTSKASLRRRPEYFGSFVWDANRTELIKLSGIDAAIFELFSSSARPLHFAEAEVEAFRRAGFECTNERTDARAKALCESGILTAAPAARERQLASVTEGILQRFVQSQPRQSVAKPVWAHLQPFLFCNLSCVHCYCNSSPSSAKLQMTLESWFHIISRLDEYGISEVYITGGETLILDATWRLINEIASRGMGFGLSTNALHIDQAILTRLREYRVDRIQVSLDGAVAETHDRLRSKVGAFNRTIRNIELLAKVTRPVINTVIRRDNINELEAIIVAGKKIGVAEYKFFPQKAVGRGVDTGAVLSDLEIRELADRCVTMSVAYDVRIESINYHVRCGSARSGFAVDEMGDAFPCIFGIADKSQRAGSLLLNSLDEIWFDSEPMRKARSIDERPCHVCEHSCTT